MQIFWHFLFLLLACICLESEAGYGYFQMLLYRSTTTSRTTRLRSINNAPGFTNGWIDEIYQVQMYFGQPSQFVNLTLDYGWGPTFVYGTGYTPCRNPRLSKSNCVSQSYPRNFFNAGHSRSFHSTELNYGYTLESPFTNDCGKKATIAGDLVEDEVMLDRWKDSKIESGGRCWFGALPFVLTQKDRVDGLLHPHWAGDGILGLGYWNGFFGDETYSFILKMLKSFNEKVVTVYLGNLVRKNFDPRGEPAGWMTLGGKDREHCDGNWVDVKASWTYGWSVVIDTFQMGDYKTSGRAGVGVFASPTAFMYAPKQIRDEIVRRTQAEYDVHTDVYFVDCNNRRNLKDMIFDLQGFKYTVPSKYYARKMYNLRGPNPRKQCALMIGESSRDDTWYLGTTFNRPYCMLFDFSEYNMKLQFSRAIMD